MSPRPMRQLEESLVSPLAPRAALAPSDRRTMTGDLPEPQDPAPEQASDEASVDAAEPRSDEQEAAWIRAAQGGDHDAFGELVRRYERRAFRVARNMVASDEDALDLAQDAFVRVFKNLHRFDFKHEFQTWLYRIVTNLCIDHLRKRRPNVSTAALGKGAGMDDEPELALPDPSDARPSDEMEREETVAMVRDCIDSLAPHFQTVMVLRELEGLPCTEIAEIVGATHVTVRWRLHRGRKLFQEEWQRRERAREKARQEGS